MQPVHHIAQQPDPHCYHLQISHTPVTNSTTARAATSQNWPNCKDDQKANSESSSMQYCRSLTTHVFVNPARNAEQHTIRFLYNHQVQRITWDSNWFTIIRTCTRPPTGHQKGFLAPVFYTWWQNTGLLVLYESRNKCTTSPKTPIAIHSPTLASDI